ncbi:MAG: hypothetical protein LBO77_04175 [Desulfovibrio sp.]|jgi:hypothetical protein|nr:hypothetical protein [Desulfovibrio sp.]
MILFLRIFLSALLLASLAGCASDGSLRNPFSSSEETVEPPHYVSEFADVAIPSEMSEDRDKTYITFASSGLKCGVQHFRGRLEVVSLMNAMRRNMAANGWTLRALLRSSDSILVFEKAESICTLYIYDGSIYTNMVLFISARLEGDVGGALLSGAGASGGLTDRVL